MLQREWVRSVELFQHFSSVSIIEPDSIEIRMRQYVRKHKVSVQNQGKLPILAMIQSCVAALQNDHSCNKLTNCGSSELVLNRFTAIIQEEKKSQVD